MNANTFVMMTFALATGCSMFQHGSNVGDYVYPEDFDLFDGPELGRITGVVYDVDGYPVSNLPVTLADGREALTNEDGIYRFDEVEPGEYMVRVSVIEFAEQFRRVSIEDWETETANFELYPTTVVWEFDNAMGGLFQEGRATIDVPPFAFARPGEQARGGDVQLALTVPDVLETGIQGAPGDFLTYDDAGNPQLIASYGFWDIRVFQGGEEINVASDAVVGLTYEMFDEDEMPAMQKGTLGDTMPLWWFDGEAGAWVLEDELEVVEDDLGQRSVTAEMEHFTPWNCDALFAASCIEVFVKDAMGNGIEGATTVLGGVDYLSGTGSTTDENGIAILFGMPGGTADLVAQLVVNGKPYTEEIPFVQLGAAIDMTNITVCPVRLEIELPVCMVGGDIRLNVNNYFSKDDRGDVNVMRMPSGAAMFYEPSGDYGACADPIGEELDPGDWITIEPQDTTEDPYTPEDYSNVMAGDNVRLSDDTVAINMQTEDGGETDGLYIVVDEENAPELVGELLTDGANLELKVEGQRGGLPGFVVEDAIDLAATPVVENAEDGVQFIKGDELTIEVVASDSSDPTYVSVMGEDGTMYLGKFDAQLDPTLPAWLTEKMSSNSSVTLFKQNVTFVQVPNGTYARTSTMNSTVVVANEQ